MKNVFLRALILGTLVFFSEDYAYPAFKVELGFQPNKLSTSIRRQATFFTTPHPDIVRMHFENEPLFRDVHIADLMDIFDSDGRVCEIRAKSHINQQKCFYLSIEKEMEKRKYLDGFHMFLFPRFNKISLGRRWRGELSESNRAYLQRSRYPEGRYPQLETGYRSGLGFATLSLRNNRMQKKESSFKPYQDRLLIHTFQPKRYQRQLLFAVFDGHGEQGHRVAERFRSSLPDAIIKAGLDDFNKPVQIILKEAITQIELSLQDFKQDTSSNQNDGPGFRSGTTAMIVFVRDNSVYHLHVGDSKFLWTHENSNFLFDFYRFNETREHTLGSYQERDRVGEKNIIDPSPNGPRRSRIYKNGKGLLDMSRSLGDFYLKDIISSEPEVGQFLITDQTRYGILATDGLFKPISAQQVFDWVNESMRWGTSPRVPQLTNAALRLGKEVESTTGDVNVDDLTMIAISFSPVEKPSHSRPERF